MVRKNYKNQSILVWTVTQVSENNAIEENKIKKRKSKKDTKYIPATDINV